MINIWFHGAHVKVEAASSDFAAALSWSRHQPKELRHQQKPKQLRHQQKNCDISKKQKNCDINRNQKNWDINKSQKLRHQQKTKQFGHQQNLKAFQKCFSSLCSAMWPDEFDLTKGVTTLWLRMVAPIIIQSSECCNRDIEQVIDYRQWGVMTLFFK